MTIPNRVSRGKSRQAKGGKEEKAEIGIITARQKRRASRQRQDALVIFVHANDVKWAVPKRSRLAYLLERDSRDDAAFLKASSAFGCVHQGSCLD